MSNRNSFQKVAGIYTCNDFALRLQFVFFLSGILIERGVCCLESTRGCFCELKWEDAQRPKPSVSRLPGARWLLSSPGV